MEKSATGIFSRRNLGWMMVLSLAAAAGCVQQRPAEAASPSEVTSAATAAPVVSSKQSAGEGPVAPAASSNTSVALSEGMAYADLRKALLANGWKPKVDAQCKANVVGGDFADVCQKDPGRCKVCNDVPELSSCSGDGHCLMRFQRNADESLSVSTYGEISDWNVSGTASRLFVKWWDPQAIDGTSRK